MVNTTKKKTIYMGELARRLLYKGFPIIDIKPYHENKDRTVFVFEETEALNREIDVYRREKNNR